MPDAAGDCTIEKHWLYACWNKTGSHGARAVKTWVCGLCAGHVGVYEESEGAFVYDRVLNDPRFLSLLFLYRKALRFLFEA